MGSRTHARGLAPTYLALRPLGLAGLCRYVQDRARNVAPILERPAIVPDVKALTILSVVRLRGLRRKERLQTFGLRADQNLFGIALFRNDALVQEHHLVGHVAGKIHLMCHDDHRAPLFGQ